MSIFSDVLSGALMPYVLLVVFGFLPSEIWRVLAVFAVQGLDEGAEVLIWVRAVATALLAGIVAKIVLHPSGALQHVPLMGRSAALIFAIAMFFVLKRRVIPAVLCGEAALILIGWWWGGV